LPSIGGVRRSSTAGSSAAITLPLMTLTRPAVQGSSGGGGGGGSSSGGGHDYATHLIGSDLLALL
jgi:hypothetical protein